jgi:hypothetical protein
MQINVPWYNKKKLWAKTQMFMLVLEKNGDWKRYNLSDDSLLSWQTDESGSKQLIKLADLLRQHLPFEQFVRDYSSHECHEQQRSTA